jgi:hypothetical protein
VAACRGVCHTHSSLAHARSLARAGISAFERGHCDGVSTAAFRLKTTMCTIAMLDALRAMPENHNVALLVVDDVRAAFMSFGESLAARSGDFDDPFLLPVYAALQEAVLADAVRRMTLRAPTSIAGTLTKKALPLVTRAHVVTLGRQTSIRVNRSARLRDALCASCNGIVNTLARYLTQRAPRSTMPSTVRAAPHPSSLLGGGTLSQVSTRLYDALLRMSARLGDDDDALLAPLDGALDGRIDAVRKRAPLFDRLLRSLVTPAPLDFLVPHRSKSNKSLTMGADARDTPLALVPRGRFEMRGASLTLTSLPAAAALTYHTARRWNLGSDDSRRQALVRLCAVALLSKSVTSSVIPLKYSTERRFFKSFRRGESAVRRSRSVRPDCSLTHDAHADASAAQKPSDVKLDNSDRAFRGFFSGAAVTTALPPSTFRIECAEFFGGRGEFVRFVGVRNDSSLSSWRLGRSLAATKLRLRQIQANRLARISLDSSSILSPLDMRLALTPDVWHGEVDCVDVDVATPFSRQRLVDAVRGSANLKALLDATIRETSLIPYSTVFGLGLADIGLAENAAGKFWQRPSSRSPRTRAAFSASEKEFFQTFDFSAAQRQETLTADVE